MYSKIEVLYLLKESVYKLLAGVCSIASMSIFVSIAG